MGSLACSCVGCEGHRDTQRANTLTRFTHAWWPRGPALALLSFPPVSGASKIPFSPGGLPVPSGSLVQPPPVAASSRPVELQAVASFLSVEPSVVEPPSPGASEVVTYRRPVEPQAQGATVGAPGGDLVAGLARSLQGALGISKLVHNPQQDYGL